MAAGEGPLTRPGQFDAEDSAARPDLVVVGERMRVAREAAGIDQAVLGDRIGRTQACVSRWESGERDPGVTGLLAVASALGVEASSLLAGSSRHAA